MTVTEKLINVAYEGSLTKFVYAPFDAAAILDIDNTHSFVVERIHWYSCRQHPRPQAIDQGPDNGIFLLQIETNTRLLAEFVSYQIPFGSQVLIGGALETNEDVSSRLQHMLIVTERGDCDIIFESLRERSPSDVGQAPA